MAAPTPPPRELSDIDLPIPDKWFAQVAVDESDQAVHSGWVRSFDDQVLHKLIDRALVDNFDLKATAARVEAAMAQHYFILLEARLQIRVAERSVSDCSTIASLARDWFERELACVLDVT